MALGDYGYALNFRDLIQKMVEAKVDEVRPAYRYGVVQTIDRTNRKCTVRLTGDTVDVTVNMNDQQPIATSQVVQIDGIGGDRFISAVKGDAYDPFTPKYNSNPAADFTAAVNQFYYVNANANNVTVTLPATARVGDWVWLKRYDSSAFTLTVKPTTGEQIDGVVNDTITIDAQNDGVAFFSTGSNNWARVRFGFGTSAATIGALVRRDAAGRAQFATPAAAADAATKGYVDAAMPAGSVQTFAGAAAPAGWLLCDGSSQLRATYPALFTAIGTTYGSVDGTHFTLPDMRGRVPFGVDATHALASTGGTLTHQHPLSDAGQGQLVIGVAASPAIHVRRVSTGSWTSSQAGLAGGGTESAAQANGIGLMGTTDAGSSLQPYLALNYIIKT